MERKNFHEKTSEYRRSAAEYSCRAANHFAQFYEDDSVLLENLVHMLKRSLDNDQGVVIIATAPHLQAVMDSFHGSNTDLALSIARKQIILCDAEQILDSFMVNGLPNRESFMKHVGLLVQTMAHVYDRIFAFGEMVNILWQRGLHRATIELEALWNELLANIPITLFCAYDIRSFSAGECGSGVAAVCSCHAQVFPSGTLQF